MAKDTKLRNVAKDTNLGHDVAEAHSWHPNYRWQKFDCLEVGNKHGGCYVGLHNHAEYLDGYPGGWISEMRNEEQDDEEEHCVEKMESAVTPSSPHYYGKYGAWNENISES